MVRLPNSFLFNGNIIVKWNPVSQKIDRIFYMKIPGKLPGKTYCIIEILTVTAYHLLLHSGGPDGEMGASMRYLSQRFTAPNRIVAGVLNDVGTEELAHLEMVSTIVHQLTCNLSLVRNSELWFCQLLCRPHSRNLAAGGWRSSV